MGPIFDRSAQYRRRAILARQRGTQATDQTLKSMFDEVADHWLALGEQADLLERQAATGTATDAEQQPKKEGGPPT
jgi:plasmid maintenance system antidote protein VapI